MFEFILAFGLAFSFVFAELFVDVGGATVATGRGVEVFVFVI
jgi:hypothetical protein